MSKLLWLLASAVGGAGLVRLFDRRRNSGQRRSGSGQGVLSSSDSPAGAVDDSELVRLLQEEIGRDFTQPTAIRVSARAGVVTLSGAVLASEHGRLLDEVRAFRGVRAVEDQLRRQRQRGDLPDIHTGSDRHDDEGV